MREELAAEVREAFHDRFLKIDNEAWSASYLQALKRAQSTTEQDFRTRDFQKWLWEAEDVSSIGSGSSVVVTGAYDDREIVDAIWALRNWVAPQDILERARAVDAEFDRILSLASPRHNARRPSARLTRIFAKLRPNDALCLLDWGRTSSFRAWLEQDRYRLGIVGQHVICREALRQVLGPEGGLEDSVRYSQFSWFVWDNIIHRQDPEALGPAPAGPGQATATPSLTILPAKVQRKGLNYLSNNLDILLVMMRAAENGIDRESLDQQIAEEAPMLNRGSRANLLAQAPALGLLSFDNGTYRLTALGRALVEGEPPSEVLTPVLVRGVFGFAQILDDLGRTEHLTREQIALACRDYYPRWTSDFMPNQLVAWMKTLGLVDIDGAGAQASVKLTQSGEYWRSGLPGDIKVPALLLSDQRPDEKIDADEEDSASIAAPTARLQSPTLAAILARFRQNEQLKALVFSDAQIGLIHAALHSAEGKRFVLLAGLSGTGKTSMAQGYARAYCEALGLTPSGHYEQVAVWPDWTDPTGLLGFVNPLATPPTFQETAALRLLLTANLNPDKPYFLCLDEMNLARVEHYFAPFLSAMEGREGKLTIHSSRDAVDAIPSRIAWPTNLFILGTVNMDETTYPFSDKVLDRAFTFEFWDVDLTGWRAAASARGAADDLLGRVFPVLEAMSNALRPARRHFGYRTCNEVLGFVTASGDADFVAALDAAVLAKILPKVRGDSGGALPQAIADAISISTEHGLVQTREKLVQMQSTLKEMGAVRFWS